MATTERLQTLLSEYLPRDEGWIGHGRLLTDLRNAVEEELGYPCSDDEFRNYLDRALDDDEETAAPAMAA